MRHSRLPLIAALACLAALGHAQTPQPWNGANTSRISQQHPFTLQYYHQAFDDFTLATPTVFSSLCWTGARTSGFNPLLGFEISLYTDNAAFPGPSALFWRTYVAGPANETFAGAPGGVDFYNYHASWQGVALGPGTYWLSIVGQMEQPPQWSWANSNIGNGLAFYDGQPLFGEDMAFKVNCNPVPEPGTIGLAIAALGTAAGKMRRRRGTKGERRRGVPGRAALVLRALCLVLLAGGVAMRASAYDASSSFSIGSNPNGVWSYGYTTSLGGTFIPYTLTQSNTPLSGIDSWTANLGGTNTPIISKNTTSNNLMYSTVRWQPHQLTMHPGVNGEYSVLRFTAPTTTTYSFAAGFIGQDIFHGTTDVHVLHNSSAVWNGTVSGYLNTDSGSGLVAMTAGDFLDIAVGPGPNDYRFDTTGVEFNVNPVPEPFTMVLGAAALAVAANRRRRA